MEDKFKLAKENMIAHELVLSKYACKSKDAILLKRESKDIRPTFFRDIDKIIHSSGYARYIDKTQVYSFVQNDHITRRVLHVQLVSKIARTIGRSLNLNEDLIEAIALGHDVGHTPFGHKGEELLNNICKKEGIGFFCHNCQSVRVLRNLEGLNISIQTLDGILAHNGEILKNKYEYLPKKTASDFEQDYQKALFIEDYSKNIQPMTLEACVVRLSDIIAYIGRDIEDAIVLEVIKREDITKNIKKVLGDTNTEIVNTLIKDVIENSINKKYLKFSDKIFEALMELKDWNYKNIYNSNVAVKNYSNLEKLFNGLYKFYLGQTEKIFYDKNSNADSLNESEKLFFKFINNRIEKNPENTDIRRIIVDYLAGQTDKFFLRECKIHLKDINIDKLYE